MLNLNKVSFQTNYSIPEQGLNESKNDFTIQKFLDLSTHFQQAICSIPTRNNQIRSVIDRDSSKSEQIVAFAKSTRPILHQSVTSLIKDFLDVKRNSGSSVEKNLYQTITVEAFIDRLLKNRPLMFMCSFDSYLLRDGKTKGTGGFEQIGKEEEKAPLLLKNYLSYEEMQISALLGVSVPTFFINEGGRTNRAQLDQPGTFIEQGVYVGLVGARFERPGQMEQRHMLVSKQQNTEVNGYGLRGDDLLLKAWAKFYEVSHFPSYEEAKADRSGRFIALESGVFLDAEVYKRRIKKIIETFLKEAEARGEEQGKSVYIHSVGLGLGTWSVHEKQKELTFKAFEEVIQNSFFKNIKDIAFTSGMEIAKPLIAKAAEKGITIHFTSYRVAKFKEPHNPNQLLVASYAWDGNSYPGNEYWIGALTASGDPAAACCSLIPELQNPMINPYVCGENTRFF